MANGDTNGDDDDDSEESEELTEAQKDEKLKQIAKEYAIPGRPYNSGEEFILSPLQHQSLLGYPLPKVSTSKGRSTVGV
jgi:hypothetical protein